MIWPNVIMIRKLIIFKVYKNLKNKKIVLKNKRWSFLVAEFVIKTVNCWFPDNSINLSQGHKFKILICLFPN